MQYLMTIIVEDSKTFFLQNSHGNARVFFFEIYRKFGHMPSKRFANRVLHKATNVFRTQKLDYTAIHEHLDYP